MIGTWIIQRGPARSFIEQKFGMERMARDTKEAYESLLSST